MCLLKLFCAHFVDLQLQLWFFITTIHLSLKHNVYYYWTNLLCWFACDLYNSGSVISLKLPDLERDEAVKYAWDTLWQGLVDHVIDKQYYPRYITFAVATTVAQVYLYMSYL